MIKSIIFDAYGTLISTSNGSVKACEKILANKEVGIDTVEFYQWWKKIHKRNILSIGDFISEEDIFLKDLEELYSMYCIAGDPDADVKFMIDSLLGRKAFADVVPSLKALSPEYKLYIGSTSDTKPLLENLAQNKITVDGVYTSQSLCEYKPHYGFYHKILKDIGLNPSEVVFVGDSLEDDVFGPQQLGIYSIWLNRNKLDNLGTIRPDAIIYSLCELKMCIP